MPGGLLSRHCAGQAALVLKAGVTCTSCADALYSIQQRLSLPCVLLHSVQLQQPFDIEQGEAAELLRHYAMP